jgi:hypothetical protein
VRTSGSRIVGRAPLGLLTFALTVCAATGCDDPMRVRTPPESHALTAFVILDPTRTLHGIHVEDAAGVEPITGKLWAGDSLVATGSTEDSLPQRAICNSWYGNSTLPAEFALPERCIPLAVTPEPGRTYRVTLERASSALAEGTTTVPGDFDILQWSVQSDRTAGVHVSATWGSSAGSHRYLVMLIGGVSYPCDPDCRPWSAITTDTVLDTFVSARELQPLVEPVGIVVHAMNRELLEYFTTGSSSGLFPIAPSQNFRGATGTIGAWVRRLVMVVNGLELQPRLDGLHITNTTRDTLRLDNLVRRDDPAACFGYSRCAVLPPGARIVSPYSTMDLLKYSPTNLGFDVCDPSNRCVNGVLLM